MTLGSITTASDGQVYLADASMFTLGGGGCDDCNFDPNIVLALDPTATSGSITVNGAVTTGRMQAAAGSDLSVNDIFASKSVELSARGLADFEGTVSAPTITVTSGDLNVGEGATLGVFRNHQPADFNAVNDGLPILIGDTTNFSPPAPGQYNLGNEPGDIQATSLVVNAIGSGDNAAPEIQILDGNPQGSQGDGGGASSITLNTGGSVFVEGNFDFRNVGAGDSLTINAGGNIEVNTDTGSLSLLDTNEQLAGTLNLNADNVWIAQQSILTQLEAIPITPGAMPRSRSTAGLAISTASSARIRSR